jgi:NADP-dependent 3-hydroxy acid dehydrogenase YdfG
MSLHGQQVVIIGASAGIGEATAKAFAARGAAVTITGRSRERLDQAARRIGHAVHAAELDATDRGALDAFFATTGTIDHLVLSASPGAVSAGPIAALDEAALRQAFDVAEAIVYLAGAGFVTGTVLECTGGSNLTAAALAS